MVFAAGLARLVHRDGLWNHFGGSPEHFGAFGRRFWSHCGAVWGYVRLLGCHLQVKRRFGRSGQRDFQPDAAVLEATWGSRNGSWRLSFGFCVFQNV